MADEDAIRKQQWLEERRKQHQENMAQRRRARMLTRGPLHSNRATEMAASVCVRFAGNKQPKCSGNRD